MTPEHLAVVAAGMRQADRDEVRAASGYEPLPALEFSLRKSTTARTILVDGAPAAIFGVGDLNVLNRTGVPWMLGTDDVERYPIPFLRGSAEWIAQLLRRYDLLRNIVDDRHTSSKRWLEWLGFTLHEPITFGLEKRPFRVFELRSPHV